MTNENVKDVERNHCADCFSDFVLLNQNTNSPTASTPKAQMRIGIK